MCTVLLYFIIKQKYFFHFFILLLLLNPLNRDYLISILLNIKDYYCYYLIRNLYICFDIIIQYAIIVKQFNKIDK